MFRIILLALLLGGISASVNEAQSAKPKYIQYDMTFNPREEGCKGAKIDDSESGILKDSSGIYHIQIIFNCDEEA